MKNQLRYLFSQLPTKAEYLQNNKMDRYPKQLNNKQTGFDEIKFDQISNLIKANNSSDWEKGALLLSKLQSRAKDCHQNILNQHIIRADLVSFLVKFMRSDCANLHYYSTTIFFKFYQGNREIIYLCRENIIPVLAELFHRALFEQAYIPTYMTQTITRICDFIYNIGRQNNYRVQQMIRTTLYRDIVSSFDRGYDDQKYINIREKILIMLLPAHRMVQAILKNLIFLLSLLAKHKLQDPETTELLTKSIQPHMNSFAFVNIVINKGMIDLLLRYIDNQQLLICCTGILRMIIHTMSHNANFNPQMRRKLLQRVEKLMMRQNPNIRQNICRIADQLCSSNSLWLNMMLSRSNVMSNLMILFISDTNSTKIIIIRILQSIAKRGNRTQAAKIIRQNNVIQSIVYQILNNKVAIVPVLSALQQIITFLEMYPLLSGASITKGEHKLIKDSLLKIIPISNIQIQQKISRFLQQKFNMIVHVLEDED